MLEKAGLFKCVFADVSPKGSSLTRDAMIEIGRRCCAAEK
jgi:hypothetical protein